MNDLFAAVIKRAEEKTGRREEVSLHYDGDFYAQAINPVGMVHLGEVEGEYTGRGATAEEALTNLLDAMS